MPKKFPDERLIRLALEEDIGKSDITTQALGLKRKKGEAAVFAKSKGIISGIDQFKTVFRILSPGITFKHFIKNGQPTSPGDKIIQIIGPLDAMLTGERTAMNILSHLSGVATMTREFVTQVKEFPVRILDTRKTMPGMRSWEKAAVRDGGGHNHRLGLYDMYLLKENHVASAGGFPEAMGKVGKHREKTGAKIEVEVRDLSELEIILPYKPDFILLDNFSLTDLKKAVEITRSKSKKISLEASGNINLDNIRTIAAAGVDRISLGALTHSAPALDLSFRILE